MTTLTTTPPATAVAYAALAGASLLWGLSTATSKYALAGFAATDLLVLEIGVATLVLWCVPVVRRRARRGFRRSYVLLGLLEPGVAYAFFNFGLERTSAADAAVLISLESLAIAVLAAVFLGERLSAALVAGLALSAGGAVVLGLHEAHRGASLAGDALVLVGVVAAAAYSVAARHVVRCAEAEVVTAYQLLGALAVAAPLWLSTSAGRGSTIAHASGTEWLAAAATGIFGSAVPFLLYTFAVARLPATRAAPLVNLIPFFGVASAVLLLGEGLSVTQLLGGVLTVAGLGTAQLRVRAG